MFNDFNVNVQLCKCTQYVYIHIEIRPTAYMTLEIILYGAEHIFILTYIFICSDSTELKRGALSQF